MRVGKRETVSAHKRIMDDKGNFVRERNREISS